MTKYSENKTKEREEYVSELSPVTGVKWAWFGGHGIHGYVGRREIAFLNTGDYSKDSLTKEEAKKAVQRIANMSSDEQSSYAIDEHEMKLIATGKYRKPYLTEKKLVKV